MLSEPILNLMAHKAAEALLMEGAVRGIDRAGLVNLLTRALAREDNVYADLVKEAEKLLAANAAALRGQKVDLGEMRHKIIQKLARERGLVLK